MFQSTHPRRGATHQTNRCAKSYGVSIHAPQAGCDPELKFLCVLIMFQSTHPRRGATLPTLRTSVLLKLFQSTHPRRGATLGCSSFGRQFQVSIHAPQAGCDVVPTFFRAMNFQFQSTHPGRGATSMARWAAWLRLFQSTHPGRGATSAPSPASSLPSCFNPRTPGGVRLYADEGKPMSSEFQSTHPGRGATV